MTTPHQSLPEVQNWLGVGAYEIGGADTNYGQGISENFVNALVKIPLPTFFNMFEVLEQVLLKLPIEILEAFKPFIPDWLEDEILDVAQAVVKILASFDIRKIPVFLDHLLDLFGIGDLLEGNNLFANLRAFLDPFGIFTNEVGSFNLLTAAEHFITEVLDPTGLLASISSILEAFGLPGLGGLTDLTTWVQDLLGMLGVPLGLGTGSPTIPSLHNIPLLGSVQDIVDGFFEKLTGVTRTNTTILDMLTALSSIPSHIVAGVGGPSTIGQSFQAIIDHWVSGLVGFMGNGASLSDLFNLGQGLSSGSTLGKYSWDILGIRSNKPFWTGLLPTGVSNIPMPGLTSSTAPTFALTQSTATMDYHRIDEGSSKGVVSWIGSGVSSITHFFINIFKVDPVTGLHTLVHSSPNIVGDVLSTLGTNIYTLVDSFGVKTPLAVLPGEVYGIEKSIRGAGTHNIVGAASWMNFDHPSVFPKRMASVRNSGTSDPPATIAAGSVSYSSNIAFTEFAIEGSIDGHAPDLRTFLDAGSTSVVVPTWASYAEVVVVGPGGDGATGSPLFYGSNGRGGAAGSWATALWTKGTHFSAGDTISIVVGQNGSYSTATVNGNTVYGTPGASGSGTGSPTYGASPGNISFGTPAIPYAGGVQQNTLGAAGAAPGGGGAGGAYFPIIGKPGGHGAKGAVFIRFRQGENKEVSPTGASLTITGGTPVVTSSKIITPTPAALSITGGQPLIINTLATVQPSPASLTITGGQPVVTANAPIILQPSGASLSITGGQPDVTIVPPVPATPPSLKASGSWSTTFTDTTVSLVGSPAAGDRYFLWVTWKSGVVGGLATCQVSGWTEIAEYANGTVGNSTNAGSVKVACYYKDWAPGLGNPTVDFSFTSGLNAGVVMQLWQKDPAQTWDTPTFSNGNMVYSSTPAATANATHTTVPGHSVVMCLVGKNRSGVMTRPTTGINNTGSTIAYGGDYVESPAAQLNSTSGNTWAGDLGHRVISTGVGAGASTFTAELSATAGSGSALWVVQGVS